MQEFPKNIRTFLYVIEDDVLAKKITEKRVRACVFQKKVVILRRFLCARIYYEGIIDRVGTYRSGGFAAECGCDSEEGS